MFGYQPILVLVTRTHNYYITQFYLLFYKIIKEKNKLTNRKILISKYFCIDNRT